MALNTTLRGVSSKLMAKFGGEATIRRVTPGVYDSATGTVTETVADAVVRGVLDNVNIREVNDLIQAGDKKLMIAAADVTAKPETADRVLITGTEYQVVRVNTIEQDNMPIVYELLLRA